MIKAPHSGQTPPSSSTSSIRTLHSQYGQRMVSIAVSFPRGTGCHFTGSIQQAGNSASHLERHQKFNVVPGLLEFTQEQFHGFVGGDAVKYAAQGPNPFKFVRPQQEFFFAGAAFFDVDGREHPLVGKLAVQDHFQIASALEVLVHGVVLLAAGFDQDGGKDGQAAAVFEVAGGAEEALGLVDGGFADGGGGGASGMGVQTAAGPGQAGEGIQENDHVPADLDQALGLFAGQFGNLDVPFGGFVKGGAEDLSLDVAFHVGDFFGALVDEQHDEIHVLGIGGDAVGASAEPE